MSLFMYLGTVLLTVMDLIFEVKLLFQFIYLGFFCVCQIVHPLKMKFIFFCSSPYTVSDAFLLSAEAIFGVYNDTVRSVYGEICNFYVVHY